MGIFTSNKTTSTKPWRQQRQHLIKIFNRAEHLFGQGGPQYYNGNTVAGFTNQQRDAFRIGQRRALRGNEGVNASENFNTDVVNGQYNKDPYLGKVYKQIENRVLPSVNSTFSMGGRYGSNAHQDTAASALTREFAPIAQEMNQQGLNRQERAADRSFNFGSEDYRNLGALESIGQKRQMQNQNVINADKERWDFNQNRPWDALQRYSGLVQGNYGGSQSYQAPSTFASMLGMGLSAVPILGGAYNTFMKPQQSLY